MKRPPSLAKLQARCDKWNLSHPIGSTVWYHPVIGEAPCSRYETRTVAQVLSGHTCVVWLVGFSGCVALDALTNDHTQQVTELFERGRKILVEGRKPV